MSYKLPDLEYEYNSLEPYIDEETMHLHHDKHHQAYLDKFKTAIEQTPLNGKSIEEILSNINVVPEAQRSAVRNNGGGYANHSLYWKIMGPNAGNVPEGKLADAINDSFGSFDEFKKKFSDAAATQFGSGWAWLVVNKDKKLEVTKTSNQDTPLSEGKIPILNIDVWEHAYYLNYKNKRPDYIEAFYNVINWKKVSELFANAML